MASSNMSDPNQAVAGMAKQGRVPMGTSGYTFNDASSAPSKNTTLVPKGGAQAADPTLAPQPGTHTYAAYNRNGAHYGIVVNYVAQTSPEAGATQANGRIVRSVAGKSAPNFYDGAGASVY